MEPLPPDQGAALPPHRSRPDIPSERIGKALAKWCDTLTLTHFSGLTLRHSRGILIL